jgi:hypothetical protein
MTPTIYKLAYTGSVINCEGFHLFQNDGNTDVALKTFETEAELLQYLAQTFEKVGEISDYGLYIRKSFQGLTS